MAISGQWGGEQGRKFGCCCLMGILTGASSFFPVTESRDIQAEMVVRLQAKSGGWAWIYCLLYSEGPEGPITANNYPIR